ncbi:phage gp16-like protein [Hephaestia caeni]|uniref:Phage gp16-like protein n=1 Tax=Hephaestia caeni TaxID=645617 RepID=A0A397P7N2_9SPHN|nr:regulatory protein GemA [Hephaestia caeni]RIA44069.1 phage gp16-like protein [Hephaestia caeni]
MNQYATARFDGARQRRRVLIAKVHVAIKQLGLADDDYRAMLFRITGRMSAGECTEEQLVLVIDELKAKGFSAKPKAGAPRAADHPGAMKARALWISLHHLGVVRDGRESALEAFARRQLGCDKLQWANQSQMYLLIEALKKMAERAGWSQDLSGVPAARSVQVLKHRLCDALLAKLKDADLAPRDWRLGDAAWRLAGIRPGEPSPLFWSASEFDLIAAAFGRLLREGPRPVSAGEIG